MSTAVKELLEKRAKLVGDARAILERNKAAGTMPADDQAQYDRIFADANKITLEVEERNSFDSRQAQLEKAGQWDTQVAAHGTAIAPETPAVTTSAAPVMGHRGRIEKRAYSAAHSDAFYDYVTRRSNEDQYRSTVAKLLPQTVEYRDLLADTAGSGHDLLPPVEFIDQILIPRDRQVWIRKWATIRKLTKSTDGYLPTVETNPDDPDWTTEVVTVNNDNTGGNAAGGMTTGKRELKPNVLTKLVKCSIKELMVLPQIAGLIADRLGYKFGVAEEKAFMVGTGTNQPLGVFSTNGYAANIPAIAASDLAFANGLDGLQNAKFALPPPYWANAKWVFHPTIMMMVATIKDTLGRYIWQPNTIVGQPDMLLGFPAILDVWAPSTVTLGSFFGILGDFSYYHIADLVEQFSVQRLNELYAGTNEVGFIGREYCDGMPVMAEAFVRLQFEGTYVS
jgi:HK97 family phage major capsid protein